LNGSPITANDFRNQRVLAVFAHPDDETWAAGGLLRRVASTGGIVHLVTLSHGERGFDHVARRRDGALAEARYREIANACARLGVASFEVLGLPDMGVTAVATKAGLAPILAAFEPDVLVGFDRDGGYGHIDHVLGVLGTFAAVSEFDRPPRLIAPVFPPGLLTPLRDWLARHHRHLVHPDVRSGPLGGESATFTLELTCDEATAKRRALLCHASQLDRGGVDGFLGIGVMASLFHCERYREVVLDAGDAAALEIQVAVSEQRPA